MTQSFNTTTSMGRLTLNVLLSFAQFEREVTGERIRDKIAASKKKGLWVGGVVPLGYEVKDRKLIVNEEEAATVRLIFSRYLDLGSLAGVCSGTCASGGSSPERERFPPDAHRRAPAHQWAAGPYAAQPNVPRRDQPSRQELSRRARTDHRRETVRSGPGQADENRRGTRHATQSSNALLWASCSTIGATR